LQAIIDAVRRPPLAAALVAVALACMTESASGDRVSARAAAASDVMVERGDRGRAVRSIQAALGIPADGIFGPQTGREVRRFQRRKGLTVDGVVGPQTLAALGLQPLDSRSVHRQSSDRSLPRALRRIAECESGGNPKALSPGGTYRGKYQFSRDTWRGLGGKGDPAAAPESVQDRMALRLYRRSGTAAWPSCA